MDTDSDTDYGEEIDQYIEKSHPAENNHEIIP